MPSPIPAVYRESVSVTFFTDARTFLAAACDIIAADPLHASVISVAALRQQDQPMPLWAWFAIVEADGERAIAMRTRPDQPHAGFVASMSTAAVDVLVAALRVARQVQPSRRRYRCILACLSARK